MLASEFKLCSDESHEIPSTPHATNEARGCALPRFSLSSPAISLRKCHMEMTAEEARVNYHSLLLDLLSLNKL